MSQARAFAAAQPQPVNNPPEVLIINSYHQGFLWTDDILRGIRDVLSSSNTRVSVDIEYLDQRRHPVDWNLFAKLLTNKLRSSQPQVVIATDDAAVRFLIAKRPEVFPNVPVVFCGVNEFRGSGDYVKEHRAWMTGVLEIEDFDSTVRLALRLHPGTHNLVTVGEPTWMNFAGLIATEFPSLHVWHIPVQEQSREKTIAALTDLPAQTVVIFSTFTRDGEGRAYTMAESTKLVHANCRAPLYAVSKPSVGHGVIGGNMADSFEQGRWAARLAIQVLSGTPVDKIPIVSTGTNRYEFDRNELLRWNISERDLPPGSIVINKPKPFYAVHPVWVWSALFFVSVQSAVIVLLSVQVKRRRLAEETMRSHSTKLAQSNYMLEQFAYVTAHDFQEPIRNVAIFTQVLGRRLGGRFDSDVQEALGFIEIGSHRMYLMVRGLVAWVRAVEPQKKASGTTDIGQVVSALVAKHAAVLRTTNARVKWGSLPSIAMDGEHVREVLEQILMNAVHHGNTDDLVVAVSGVRDKKTCTVQIEDNGVGVPPDMHERVFGVFRRGHTPNGEHIGMGLAICRRIIHHYSGTIWIESSPMGGCRVCFSVPV